MIKNIQFMRNKFCLSIQFPNEVTKTGIREIYWEWLKKIIKRKKVEKQTKFTG